MKTLPVFLALCTGAFFAEMVRQRRPNPPSESRSSTFVEAAPRQDPIRPPRDSDALADLSPIRPSPPPAPPPPRETPATIPARSAEPRPGGTQLAGRGEGIPIGSVSKPAPKFYRLGIVGQAEAGMAATGDFYDPEYVARPGELQKLPKYRNPLNQPPPAAHNDWPSTNDIIIIRGLTGVSEGDQWSGMLERDGVANYIIPDSKKNRTVQAYRLSNAPKPYFAPKNPRAWMWK
jgi:hypothetical protein